MANRKFLSLASIVALGVASTAALTLSAPVSGADTNLIAYHVPGEKLDSGLGEMPPYWPAGRQQAAAPREPAQAGDHVLGEKLDSGLGELPPYRGWTVKYRPTRESGIKQALK